MSIVSDLSPHNNLEENNIPCVGEAISYKLKIDEIDSAKPVKKLQLCTICCKNFNNRSNLRKHVRRFHPNKESVIVPLKNKNPDNFKLTCHLCGRNYNIERSYRYHLKSVHGTDCDNVRNGEKKCPLCNFKNLTRTKLLSHFVSEHSVPIENETMVFDSLESAMEWKERMEHDTMTRFVKDYEQSRLDCTVIGYRCHRSGNYKSRGRGKRRLKLQGSNKIDAFCPALIHISAGKTCEVKFQSTHIGHVNDASHLTLSSQDKSILIEKLSSEMPFHSIIDEIKKTAVKEEGLKRIHTVSRKDLHNIKHRLSSQQEFQQKVKFKDNVQELITEDCEVQKLDEPRIVGHTEEVFSVSEEDKYIIIPLQTVPQLETSSTIVGNIVTLTPVQPILSLDKRKEELKQSMLGLIDGITTEAQYDFVCNHLNALQYNSVMTHKVTDFETATTDVTFNEMAVT